MWLDCPLMRVQPVSPTFMEIYVMIHEEETGNAKPQCNLRVHCDHTLLVSVHVMFHLCCIWSVAYRLQKDFKCKAECWAFNTLKIVPLNEGVFLHSYILSCAEIICPGFPKIVWDQCQFSPCKDEQLQHFIKKTFVSTWASPKHMPLKVLALETVKELSQAWIVSQQAKASTSVQLKMQANCCKILWTSDTSGNVCHLYHLAIWSSLCPAFSACDACSLTEEIQR